MSAYWIDSEWSMPEISANSTKSSSETFFSIYINIHVYYINFLCYKSSTSFYCFKIFHQMQLYAFWKSFSTGKYCPLIKEVDISAVKVTDVSLRNLVSRCTNLHKVKLSRCLHVTDTGYVLFLYNSQVLFHEINESYERVKIKMGLYYPRLISGHS
jgi:hypothetical protein